MTTFCVPFALTTRSLPMIGATYCRPYATITVINTITNLSPLVLARYGARSLDVLGLYSLSRRATSPACTHCK